MPEQNKPDLLDIALETLESAAKRVDALDLRTVRAFDIKRIALDVRMTLEILQILKRKEI